jgi:hypothetical protein
MRRLPTFATLIAVGAIGASAQAQFASRAAPAQFDSAAPSLPPTGCGSKDDGSTENALGLTAGGQMGWMKVVTCSLDTYDSVATAYGTLMFPGSVTNGANGTVAVYTAPAADPTPNNAAVALKTLVNTVVVNGDTDIVNKISLGTSRTTVGPKIVLASADQVAGQFPGPMDQGTANPEAWVVGSTLGPGSLNVTTLTANNVPPLNMGAIGFPSTWLLRLENTGGGTEPGTKLCHGAGCPCGNNDADANGGCSNGPPMPAGAGAQLSASGTNSIGNDDLVLTADVTTNQPGLMFQGDVTINGGSGVAFGDGLRCCGTNVIRLELIDPPGANGVHTVTTTQAIIGTSPPGTIAPGVKQCYQWWYRNPGRSLCGANFNLSNAVTVNWVP